MLINLRSCNLPLKHKCAMRQVAESYKLFSVDANVMNPGRNSSSLTFVAVSGGILKGVAASLVHLPVSFQAIARGRIRTYR